MIRERTEAGENVTRFLILRIAPAVALAGLMVARSLPRDGWNLPLCLFKRWTGYPCLSCGLTRSFLYAVHGDWVRAYQLHPLGLPLVAVCVVVAISPLLPAPIRRRWQSRLFDDRLWITRLCWAALAVLLLNGAYRFWWIAVMQRASLW